MKSKKSNEEIKTEKGPGLPWNHITVAPGPELSERLTSVPKGTLRKTIALEMNLEAQRPPVMTSEEQRRFEKMKALRVVADAALEHAPANKGRVPRALWGAVVSRMASVTATIAAHRGSNVPVVVERAEGAAKAAHLGGPPLSQMSGPEAWVQVNKTREALSQAEVYDALTRIVPAELLEALFEAHDRLGVAMGMIQRHETATVVDLETVHQQLRRRIDAYVRCIAGSADDDDPASVERAATALRPIGDFRAMNERRMARTAAARSAEEADEEVPATTTPVAAPAAPTAPPGAAEEDPVTP